jgi:hypothetical protein
MKNSYQLIKLGKAVPMFLFVLILCFAFMSYTEAASGSYNNGEWRIRVDTTLSKYGCSAAPSGKVTGNHLNFEIYDKSRKQLFNFHIWLGYLPKLYISEGSWCIKIDQTTWKNLLTKISDYMQKRLSKTAIKSLTDAMSNSKVGVMPLLILVPNCNNPPSWDIYSKLMCYGVNGIFPISL